MLIRDIEAGDLPAVHQLLESPPWTARAGELRSIVAEAAGPPGREHEGACAVDGDALTGVVLFRFVAGAVHTGEIECLAAREPAAARMLLDAAIEHLRDGGARIVVAEYPGAPGWLDHAALLAGAGFREEARIEGYCAENVPLVIDALRLG